MILEFFTGVVVSVIAIYSFLSLRYVQSINNWILVTSKFIYYSGHPLLDDDQIFNEITNRFKRVFTTISLVVLKTLLLLFIILVLLALSAFLVSLIRSVEFQGYNSPEFVNFLFPEFLIKIPFLLGSIVPVFLVPLILKGKNKDKEVYSSIDKFLHYIFLGNKNIANFLFKLELWSHKKQLKKSEPNQNVYISGLARAGTTVLMQYLGQLTEFKSLSYRNLPFLFLPKTGSRLISNKKIQDSERFHQDGMMHNINSYEALEEPFWRNNIGEKYIFEENIQKHEIDPKFFKKYNAFRRLISGDKIYLAKNNNHLLRAESLHELDKLYGNSTITIIPFRHPYDQAKSLLNQHLLLSELQKEDEFTLDYMDFLVHHEFGLHTKIPILNKNGEVNISYEKETIDYWLEIWYLYYSDIYKQFSNKENFYFFCYEIFIDDPIISLNAILLTLGIPNSRINSIKINNYTPKKTSIEKFNLEYNKLYANLKSISINNG